MTVCASSATRWLAPTRPEAVTDSIPEVFMLDAYRYRGRHRVPASPERATARAVVAATAGVAAAALAPAAHAAPDDAWDRLAQCESSGRWDIDTGNGYSGGLQFLAATWRGFGGGEFAAAAHHATRAEQIVVAERVLAVQGWDAWPACSRKVGIRNEGPSTRLAAPAEPSPPAAVAARASTSSYTVVRGDTLSEIAESHQTSTAALHETNRDVVEHPDLIFPGERLQVG